MRAEDLLLILAGCTVPVPVLLALFLFGCGDADPTGPRTVTCVDRPVGSPVASACE